MTITITNISKVFNLNAHKTRSLRDALSFKTRQAPNYFTALQDINLSIKAGEKIGLIGANGEGKSTLLKILSRIIRPTTGSITYEGRIASLLEAGTGFHSELTGRENIYINGAILGMSRREVQAAFDSIVAFAGVADFIDTPLKRYSSGMAVRLGFAVAAHLQPEILLVDEVLAVGDLEFRQRCLGKMQDISQQQGRTIVFVSHDISSVRQLCDRVVWLDKGRIRMLGDTSTVTNAYVSHAFADDNVPPVVTRQPVPSGYHLKQISLLDDAGKTRSIFNAGEAITVDITSNSPAPQDNFTIVFHLYNQFGALISMGTANPLQNVFFNKNTTHIRCRLAPVWLHSGLYSLSFISTVWGHHYMDKWPHAIKFRIAQCDPYQTNFDITSTPDGNGDFYLPQQWQALN